MSAVIEVHDFSKNYGRMQAIDSISFTLEEDRIHGLLGRNRTG